MAQILKVIKKGDFSDLQHVFWRYWHAIKHTKESFGFCFTKYMSKGDYYNNCRHFFFFY